MADTGDYAFYVGDGTVAENAAVTVAGSARIDGTFHGELDATHVVVGESGRIIGTVRGETADVEGRVEGTVTLSGQLTVRAKGVLQGHVGYGGLSVEAGARLIGDVSAGGKTAPERPTRSPAYRPATGRSRVTTDEI